MRRLKKILASKNDILMLGCLVPEKKKIQMASDIARVLGTTGTAIYGSDWGGSRQLDEFEPFFEQLSEAGEFVYKRGPDLDLSIKLDKNGEYRKVRTPAKNAIVPGMKKALIFEDWAGKSGKGALGSVVWALDNMGDLGIDSVYLALVVDCLGMSNFSVYQLYAEALGLKEFMKKSASKTYSRLESKDKIQAIGEEIYPLRAGESYGLVTGLRSIYNDVFAAAGKQGLNILSRITRPGRKNAEGHKI